MNLEEDIKFEEKLDKKEYPIEDRLKNLLINGMPIAFTASILGYTVCRVILEKQKEIADVASIGMNYFFGY